MNGNNRLQYSVKKSKSKNSYKPIHAHNCKDNVKTNDVISVKCNFGIEEDQMFQASLSNISYKIIFVCMTAKEINAKFARLQDILAQQFDNERPDIKVILFLIGVQELGKGVQKFSKRQKEELMHIATCRLFSDMGFYELEGLDQDGWPHWKKIKQIPNYTLLEQEHLLRTLIVNYFQDLSPEL